MITNQSKIPEKQFQDASALLSRHIGLEVEVAALHGSTMRGYNDPNSDIDICFLMKRPISDFLNLTTSNYFDGDSVARRKSAITLSTKMSRELGWDILVSMVDMRSMLRGIMNGDIYSLVAYENFSQRSAKVKHLFGPIVKDYFSVENILLRCGETISTNLRRYAALAGEGNEYKMERTFLIILWTLHRMLAYMSGDRIHARSIQELLEINKPWEALFPEGFTSDVVGVISARTDRSHFAMPTGIPYAVSAKLTKFAMAVLSEVTFQLRDKRFRQPSVADETRELVDLYGTLLDHEDEIPDAVEATPEIGIAVG